MLSRGEAVEAVKDAIRDVELAEPAKFMDDVAQRAVEALMSAADAEEDTRQVRIVSSGSYINTNVFVGDTEIAGVTEVNWHLRAGGLATAVVRIENVEVDLHSAASILPWPPTPPKERAA